MKICVLLLVVATAFASGQRITTIQLDGVQYFVSRMNPYSPELNYFLAYQYCRSLGLQLASFETREKADTMTQYLRNAGYTKYDFWTSGNKLGTDLFLWMSSGLPFNATFNYMVRRPGNGAVDVPPGTEPQRVARESGVSGSADSCVAMVAPELTWDARDCTQVKDFICEQTRCYYYNYGSIPVSATQGNRRPYLTTTTTTTTASPNNDIDEHTDNEETNNENSSGSNEELEDVEESNGESVIGEDNDLAEDELAGSTVSLGNVNEHAIPEDPVVGRLMTTALASNPVSSETIKTLNKHENNDDDDENIEEKERAVSIEAAKSTRPDDIPDITSLFTDDPVVKSRKETAFDGLLTHEIRSSSRSSNLRGKLEHREIPDDDLRESSTNSEHEENHTIGPYDSVQEDYVNDQPDDISTSDLAASSSLVNDETVLSGNNKEQQDEDSSTFLPEAEPDYRYNIKWRSMGKVLDPPSK